MAIYRYQPGSLLDEVTIIMNQSGGVRGYIHARSDATVEQLAQVQAGLHAQGWKTVAIMHDGKPALEVRGFKQPEKLVEVVRANGWTREPLAITPLGSDTRTTTEKWGNATLRAAGISYNVGDAAYLTYAYKQYAHEKKDNDSGKNFFNKLNMVAGVGYAMGSLALTKYGSRDQSQNIIQSASRKIKGQIIREGGVVSDDSALQEVIQEPKRSFFGRFDHLLAKYPSETLNSVYVGVGGILSAAAFYRSVVAHRAGNARERNEELWDIGLGAVTAMSAITGLAVKEKKPEEGEPHREGVGKVLDWIQEKPLRATGFGYMVATMFHGVGTYKKYRNGDQQVRDTAFYRGVFVASNVVSEILMALSSKGHGTGVKPDGSVDETVIAATAEHIARQPLAVRDKMIAQLAGYMASPEVLGGKAEDISAQLTKALADIRQNPWAKAPAGVANDNGTEVAMHPNVVPIAVKGQERPNTVVSSIAHEQAMVPHGAEAARAG